MQDVPEAIELGFSIAILHLLCQPYYSPLGNNGRYIAPSVSENQPRPQGFSLKKWVGREKALASAGHVRNLNIPEKLIYMQPAGFALTEVERSNNGK